jgi:hypothetical protein
MISSAPSLLQENVTLLVEKESRIQRQSGCDERDNQYEKPRLNFGMIVAIFGFCNA